MKLFCTDITDIHIGQCTSNSFTYFTNAMTMMASSNGNNFHTNGPLWGESTGHRRIPLTKACDAELWCFLWTFWANNRDAGELCWRRHHVHYDVAVMHLYLHDTFDQITHCRWCPKNWLTVIMHMRWQHSVNKSTSLILTFRFHMIFSTIEYSKLTVKPLI